jgi:hypothetical protein
VGSLNKVAAPVPTPSSAAAEEQRQHARLGRQRERCASNPDQAAATAPWAVRRTNEPSTETERPASTTTSHTVGSFPRAVEPRLADGQSDPFERGGVAEPTERKQGGQCQHRGGGDRRRDPDCRAANEWRPRDDGDAPDDPDDGERKQVVEVVGQGGDGQSEKQEERAVASRLDARPGRSPGRDNQGGQRYLLRIPAERKRLVHHAGASEGEGQRAPPTPPNIAPPTTAIAATRRRYEPSATIRTASIGPTTWTRAPVNAGTRGA